MIRTAVGIGTLSFLLLTAPAAFAQPAISAAMRTKLRHAQTILEGLATEDFDKIAGGAAALHSLSGSAEWKPLPQGFYAADLRVFQEAAAELQQRARVRNLDGSTLAYFQLTLSCVRCHEHLRALVRD